MKDNTNTINLETKLTRIGKQRLSENRFNPVKFALSDDGIDYNLYDSSLTDRYVKITRSPMFNVSRDASSLMKSKLSISKGFEDKDVIHDFNLSLERISDIDSDGEINSVQVSGSAKPKQYPEYTDNGTKRIKYYVTDTDLALLKNNVIFNINFLSLPTNDVNQFITVTLHDRKHFDISLTDKNVQYNQSVTNNSNLISRNFPESVSLDASGGYTDVPKTINVMCSPPRLNSVGSLNNKRGADRLIQNSFNRFNSGVNFNSTLEMTQNRTQNFNSFNLYYKGNFGYRNADAGRYDTILTLFSELTGQYENIHISIIPTQAP